MALYNACLCLPSEVDGSYDVVYYYRETLLSTWQGAAEA